MIDTSMSGMNYNRFSNLDGIEDRIIYYLLSEKNKNDQEKELVHAIWRLLWYNDDEALLDDEYHPLPQYKDIINLISNSNIDQSNKRIFRSPRLDDAWVEECSLIKIYVDSIIPKNHIISTVNVGIDLVVHEKIINVIVPDDDPSSYIDEVDGIVYKVTTKSRVSVLTKCVLGLLNGASVQGVGKLIFSEEQSIFNKAQYGLWNNRNFEGIKLVIGFTLSDNC